MKSRCAETVCALAEELSGTEQTSLLSETLEEEKDEKLTTCAEKIPPAFQGPHLPKYSLLAE